MVLLTFTSAYYADLLYESDLDLREWRRSVEGGDVVNVGFKPEKYREEF